ncbi:MAG TPA: T9SS type A sorting domain-containing protein [Bacteroidales bacterium]|nr:T9SS type A sorting domain-containing protein [Bacteroidales bacterium]
MKKFTQSGLLISWRKEPFMKALRYLFMVLLLPLLAANDSLAQVNDSVPPVALCKDITVSLSPGGGCGGEHVLLLWDVMNSNTMSLKNAMEAAGFVVTMPAVPEYQWDGTNPPLDGFAAVVHLDGMTASNPLPLAAQNALVDFVLNQGKAFIHDEWDAHEIDYLLTQTAMSPIVILKRISGVTAMMTYTSVPAYASHPVLTGVSSPFTFLAGANVGPVREYQLYPAEAIMTDQNGSAAVAVRDLGAGRIVGFSHAGNYLGSSCLSNVNVQRLYVNALSWATHRGNSCVTINASQVDNGSTDNDGISGMTVSPNYFTCANTGANTVTLTVTDNSGNSSTCQSIVTVNDMTIPVAKCRNITVNLNDAGLIDVFPYQVDNGSSDECGVSGLGLSRNTFNCTDILTNPNPVVLTVTDNSGNTKTCVANITVRDFVPAVALCHDVTVTLDENGNGTLTAQQVDNGSSDACGIAGMALNRTVFTCAELLTNPNSVTLTVTDINNNVSTCYAGVTVTEIIPPVALCRDVTVILDADGNGALTAQQVDNGSSDGCGIADMTLSKTQFSCADILTNPNSVLLTVTDMAGNTATCHTFVTVADTMSPVALCHNVTVILDAGGNGTLTAQQADNGSYDVCGIAGMALSKTAFSCDDVPFNPNPVDLVVTDIAGNTSICSLLVTVTDETAPEALCKNVTVNLDASGNVILAPQQLDNGSSDACGIAGMVIDKTFFTCDDLLTNPNLVTLTVTDINGNSSFCSGAVTVEDVTAPVVHCRNITVQLDAAGTAAILPSDVDSNSRDACGIAEMTVAPDVFDCGDAGVNTVILTVTDVSGNTSFCNAAVTVEDVMPPVVHCRNITVQLDITGTATIIPSDVDSSSWDACGIAEMTVVPDFFDCNDVGVNTVTLTVTDVNGNSSYCMAAVTVEDPVIPVFTSPEDITVYADAGCNYDISVLNTGDVTDEWDNCQPLQAIYSDSITEGACEGSHIIIRTWSVMDIHGNQSDGQVQIITVLDTIAPTFTAPPDITMTNDDFNNYGPIVSLTGDVTDEWDNCSAGLQATFSDVMAPGSNVLSRTWHLEDNCGNAAPDQVQTITVTDSWNFVILAKDLVTMKKSNVYSGGVGVKKAGGKLELRDYSDITAPGTFGVADNITKDGTSAITDATYDPATEPWPVFEAMPYTGTLSIHVPNNTTVYLNDTLYKEIVTGTNATVVFTQPVVNIDRKFDIGDGSTIKFDRCGVFRLDEKMVLRKNVNINPGNTSVKFYINQAVTVGEGAHVNGYFFLGRKNSADTAIHNLTIADSKPTKPAVFKGIFMAKSVSSGKHTNWYLSSDFHVCPPVEDPGIFKCMKDMIICYEDSAFNLLTMMRINREMMDITTDQPAIFPVGTTTVTWTIRYSNGYVANCIQHITRSGKIAVDITSAGLYCSGAVELTANVAGTPATDYLWSTGETTPVVQAWSSGEYIVNVVNSMGCYAEDTLVVAAEPADLISSYVMLARERIELKGSVVHSGGIGVMKSSDGQAELKESSVVTAPGVFAKAVLIPVDGSSILSAAYYAPATVTLPVFESDAFSGTVNVNVPDNAVVILGDSLYKDVKIGKNADVTFSSGIINIGGLLAIGDGSSVHFTPCTKMRIRGAGYAAGVNGGQLVNINPEDVPLTVYVQNNVNFKKGTVAKGKFYLGKTTGVDFKISTEDSRTVRSNDFTGIFIAKEILSAQNTYWNQSANCGACANQKQLAMNIGSGAEMTLRSYPNPFNSSTSIMFTLPEDSRVTLGVYDLSGKLISTLFDGDAGKDREYIMDFDGSMLSSGVYIYRMITNHGVYTGKLILER